MIEQIYTLFTEFLVNDSLQPTNALVIFLVAHFAVKKSPVFYRIIAMRYTLSTANHYLKTQSLGYRTHLKIFTALKGTNITIPFPPHEIHLLTGNAEGSTH